MWHLYFNRPLIILIFYIFGFLLFMKQLKGIWHKTFLKKTGSFLFSSGTKYCISKNGKILLKINLDFNHFYGKQKMDSLNNIEFAIHQQRDEYIEDLFVKKKTPSIYIW